MEFLLLSCFESMLIKIADDREPGKSGSILKDRTSIQSWPIKKMGEGKCKSLHSGRTNTLMGWWKVLQKISRVQGMSNQGGDKNVVLLNNSKKPSADPGQGRGKGQTKQGEKYISAELPDVWNSYRNIQYSLKQYLWVEEKTFWSCAKEMPKTMSKNTVTGDVTNEETFYLSTE